MKKKRYTSVPSHRHDFIEFSFVLEGKGKERINGAEHRMQPGTMVLLLPYQVHDYAADAGDTLLMYTCNFDMKLLTEGPEAAWGVHDLLLGRNQAQPAFIQLTGDALQENMRLWERMHKEYESALAWKRVMLRTLLLEALTLFVRSVGNQDADPANPPTSAAARGIWSVVQYVNDHYLEPLSLAALSERFHMHPAQLSKQFGETYGIHFVDFLHELRIRHACSLLLTSDLPISQIAYESGFSSYPTFSRVFLRIKGMTPRQYREKHGR
ncbi:AraC family transcriptional regulator [Paenibacillus hamazuiensis]|uniref:AraC family transcriptional regulator n=1 Tax=Paenibacillus hamazuiensis TaxID=2936508 RepID=UPI00200CB53B|nr:AraC family transcriptional regulator [Paenibacillus hamazuiensis]